MKNGECFYIRKRMRKRITSRQKRERRSAEPAGVGLRVKATIIGIGILGRAGAAHREGGHGCAGAVIGDALDDGVARAAVGAVGEWIAEPAVVRIAEVLPASVAGAGISGNQSNSTVRLFTAWENGEA